MAQPAVHNYIAPVAVYHFSFYLFYSDSLDELCGYLPLYIPIYVSMPGVIENGRTGSVK